MSIVSVKELCRTAADWKEEPRWAIHPAGVALLMRLARKLGIPPAAIQPSVAHYREHSNMSSVSVLYVLKLAGQTPIGSAINLLTMGAGFDVIYGGVRRLRWESSDGARQDPQHHEGVLRRPAWASAGEKL